MLYKEISNYGRNTSKDNNFNHNGVFNMKITQTALISDGPNIRLNGHLDSLEFLTYPDPDKDRISIVKMILPISEIKAIYINNSELYITTPNGYMNVKTNDVERTYQVIKNNIFAPLSIIDI